jgi:hypothetical protein
MVLEAIFDDSFMPTNVYLNELVIRHGQIAVLPAAGGQPIEVLKEIHFRTLLERRPQIPIEADFRTSFGRGSFHAEGLVNLSDSRHRVRLSGNMERLPSWLIAPLAAKDARVPILRGDIALDLSFDGRSLMRFTLDTKKTLTQAAWGRREISGELGAHLVGSYDLSKGAMTVTDGVCDGKVLVVKNLTDAVPEIKISSASVAWNPELIEFPRVQGAWGPTTFTLEGTLDRAEGHSTKLEFHQSLQDLSVYQPFAAKLFANPINLSSLKGKLRVDASLSGPMKDLAHNIHLIKIEARDATLQPKMLKTPISDINGTLRIQNLRVFETDDLFFKHAKEDYTLSGQINSAPGGVGRLHVKQKKWEANARFRLYPDRAEFSTFTLESGASYAGATGTIRNFSQPAVDADFRAHLLPDGLAADWQNRVTWLKSLKLKGIVDATGTIKGPLQVPAQLHLKLKANSARLVYSDMVIFEPIETDLAYDAGILDISYAKAGFYGGEARATAKADFTNPAKPYFESHVFTQDTDLKKFCEKLDFIKNKFSGTLNTDVVLQGYLNDAKSIKGHGNFRASQGQLWQTELFKRLKKVMFLTIEGAENLMFNTADGSFKIENGGIQSEDCVLSSNIIDVHLNGRIGFDSKLALSVISRFTSSIIKETYEVGGLAPALMNIAEKKITPYRVSGTLKDPVFAPQS